MPHLKDKTTEYFLIELIPSILGTLLFFTGKIYYSVIGQIIIMLVCVVVSTVLHTRGMREHMRFFGVRKQECRILYLTVFAIFFVLNIIMAIANAEPFYTWLFLPYKMFALLGMPKVLSAIIIQLVKLACIIIVPEMYEREQLRREDEDEQGNYDFERTVWDFDNENEENVPDENDAE